MVAVELEIDGLGRRRQDFMVAGRSADADERGPGRRSRTGPKRRAPQPRTMVRPIGLLFRAFLGRLLVGHVPLASSEPARHVRPVLDGLRVAR
ncbi:hypothetical protein [Streptomyces mirabilis]|uniref:hypothetical protein n=1 Tax=Streptomyces mirabilis TaxID=68239 RepID=UPI0031BB9121